MNYLGWQDVAVFLVFKNHFIVSKVKYTIFIHYLTSLFIVYVLNFRNVKKMSFQAKVSNTQIILKFKWKTQELKSYFF